MTKRVQAIRGMNDILPGNIDLVRLVEHVFAQCMLSYGYQEIRTPVLESTQLFKRAIGEVTDVVEKEMYTFDDLNGESITLRPEGTAGVLRTCLQHGLLHHAQQKLWYIGPMFRHEKPQKGRLRQFTHLGVEALGIAGVAVELEMIAMCKSVFAKLGLLDKLKLQINTIGELSERKAYLDKLVAYFTPHTDILDDDSRRRLQRNPLRILDSKHQPLHEIIAAAPRLSECLGASSKRQFAELCAGLDALNIPYQVNPTLVRGLDYYGHTVFEWVTDQLGSQATVCAGGRYDRLVEQLGGAANFGLGFAMGLERLVLLLENGGQTLTATPKPAICMLALGDVATPALVLAETLRQHFPQAIVVTPFWSGGCKSQFKQVDKSGAKLALILGEQEVQQKTVGVKDLRGSGEQVTVLQHDLVDYLSQNFASLMSIGA